jgi:hypothetical protein
LEQTFNGLIGFIPMLWISELFIRLCIGITTIATTRLSYDYIILYFFDTIIFHSILLVAIVWIGYLDTRYDSNTVVAIVGKQFAPKPGTDLAFELEMIRYLQELAHRSLEPVKSLGLFSINAQFILITANAVISFSVMFVQLIKT